MRALTSTELEQCAGGEGGSAMIRRPLVAPADGVQMAEGGSAMVRRPLLAAADGGSVGGQAKRPL